MKYNLILFFLFFSFSTYSQIMGEDEVYLKGERIDATFNGGGIDKFYEFINKNFDFSKVTKAGKMITSFTVNELGEVKNIRVTQFLDVESATEIIRVLKLSPNWKPATRMGKSIAVDIKIPLDFNLVPKPKQENKITSNQTNNELKFVLYNYSDVEKRPEFVGGLNNFYQFIAQNYITPEVEGLKGKVMVSFVIDVDGSLTDIKVIEDIGYGTGTEAIRVLKLCPKWIAAQQEGKPVRCQYSLPINIRSTH